MQVQRTEDLIPRSSAWLADYSDKFPTNYEKTRHIMNKRVVHGSIGTFTSRFFAFANADFMSDGLQDLNLRSVLGGGLGYRLIKREWTTPDLLGGANFTRENYVEIQRNLGAGQVGEEFKLKLGKNTSLVQNFAYFPDLTEPGGNYRTNFQLGTITMIIKWLGWQNNVTDSYVTNPPAGKKRNEFVFTSGLHVSLSR